MDIIYILLKTQNLIILLTDPVDHLTKKSFSSF